MPRHIELNPVSHLTVGTVGVPGKRTFYLQGRQGMNTISLTIEKEQAMMLANSFESLIAELETKYPEFTGEKNDAVMDMRLQEPSEVLFRVGNMGLGYNEDSDQVVVVAYELVEEEEEANVVSFWVDRTRVELLIPHIHDVVRSGRPICGNCGGPIDAAGHFCPQRNGHAH